MTKQLRALALGGLLAALFVRSGLEYASGEADSPFGLRCRVSMDLCFASLGAILATIAVPMSRPEFGLATNPVGRLARAVGAASLVGSSLAVVTGRLMRLLRHPAGHPRLSASWIGEDLAGAPAVAALLGLVTVLILAAGALADGFGARGRNYARAVIAALAVLSIDWLAKPRNVYEGARGCAFADGP